MTFLPPHRALLFAFSLAVLILLSATSTFADCPNQDAVAADDPLQMLVLGDSIMWGQGLREEEKFSSRVKCWLQEKTGRAVIVHVEAHSGAVIASTARPTFPVLSGEVNSTLPTINQQLDHATEFYAGSRPPPSLILMNGCINDIGVKNLLAASTSLEDLRRQIRSHCGDGMLELLKRVRTTFPRAHVIITGYYPIVSAQTADNAFLRLLVKRLNNLGPDAPRMTDKEMRQRLIALSEEWYKTSTASLLDAVMKTNAATGPDLFPQVSFVEIQFGPEHVFAAPDTLLWNFRYASTKVSGFTQIIVLLSLRSKAYKPDDHVRESRVKSCEATFKKPKGIKEDKQQKAAREDLFLICRYASLGHPNQMGALIYTEAIKGRLLQLIDKAGWKRDTNNAQTLP